VGILSMGAGVKRGAVGGQWQWMLAVNAVIAAGGLLYTVFVDSPRYDQYMQLLVTYHFGFIRRALVGEIISWFTDVVPLWYVYALAIAAWIVCLILFIAAFRKIFGFSWKNFPLFVFLIGSPFFFKNFAITLGHFDIYGCIWALVALHLPVGPLYPLVVAAGCIVLVLVHNLHFLLYVPTIGFVVFVRYLLVPGYSTRKLVYGLILIVLVSAAFAATTFFGYMLVSRDTFVAYVKSRAAYPIDPDSSRLWYTTIQQEIRTTWDHAYITMPRLPVYAVLIALHLPIARYLKSMIAALATPFLRIVTIAALVGISIGHALLFGIVYDYSRWVSAWAVCMILALHAIRLLPSAKSVAEPVRTDDKENLVLGWITTAIPRVGVTIPF
jgi:hypothetical protein